MRRPRSLTARAAGPQAMRRLSAVRTIRFHRKIERFRRRAKAIAVFGSAFWIVGITVLLGMAFLRHAASLVSALQSSAIREPIATRSLGHLDEDALFFLSDHSLHAFSRQVT